MGRPKGTGHPIASPRLGPSVGADEVDERVAADDPGYDRINISHRRARFVSEYLKDYNSVAAYQRAFPGASTPTAHKWGQYFTKRDLKAMDMIDLQSAGRLRLQDITRERVMLELGRLAFSDLGKTVRKTPTMLPDGSLSYTEAPLPLSEIDEDTRRAIKQMEFTLGGIKLKMHSKEVPLALLAKATGLVAMGSPAISKQLQTKNHNVDPGDVASDDELDALLLEAENDTGEPEGTDSEPSGFAGDDDLIEMDEDGNAELDD